MEEMVWKAMYMRLLDGILEAGQQLPVTASNAPAQEALNRAVQEAEELYMRAGEES